MSTKKVHYFQLPRLTDPRGNLTFIQYPEYIPFELKRIFWTYDIPGGENCCGHAYDIQEEVIISLSGSFDVIITDYNGGEQKFTLNRSYYCLYLPPKTWRRIENFSTNAVALHILSDVFPMKIMSETLNCF